MSDTPINPHAAPLADTFNTPAQSDLGDRATPRAAAAPTYVLLGELLADVPAEERFYVLEHYEDAVHSGTLKAVVAQGRPPLRLEVVTPEGRRVRRAVEDEIVLFDDRARAWLVKERQASKLAVLAVTGRIETSLERLEAGEDDFARLVEVRRKRLGRSRRRARGEGE